MWERDYLQHQLRELEDRGLTVVYPNATIFGDTRLAGRRFMDVHPSSGPVTIESLVTQRCNVMVSVLARRDAVVDAGMFDESLRSSEDFDLWLRIVRAGGQIGYHRRPLGAQPGAPRQPERRRRVDVPSHPSRPRQGRA